MHLYKVKVCSSGGPFCITIQFPSLKSVLILHFSKPETRNRTNNDGKQNSKRHAEDSTCKEKHNNSSCDPPATVAATVPVDQASLIHRKILRSKIRRIIHNILYLIKLNHFVHKYMRSEVNATLAPPVKWLPIGPRLITLASPLPQQNQSGGLQWCSVTKITSANKNKTPSFKILQITFLSGY